MPSRRLRPVAALTLALLAAPFLAATAVAAQADASDGGPARTTVHRVTWVAGTKASIHRILEQIERVAATATGPETPAELAPVPPPPPPPPDPNDLSTWMWPGDGPITSQFGRRWGRLHEGVDIDAAYGSVARAAHIGTVVSAGWENGYGNTVRIDHGNGVESRYAHLATIGVGAGQHVDRGQPIGSVGASGSVTAAHLHYEIRIGGAARNPIAWLPRGGASSAGNPG